jgi:hypothetical protein
MRLELKEKETELMKKVKKKRLNSHPEHFSFLPMFGYEK